jgi:arsenate reductase (thioredoxin)
VSKKKVLFICSYNAGRSQMAEGLLNARHANRYIGRSAGMHPGTINPITIQVMKEIGIDISRQKSKHISTFQDETFDLIVTLCDHDTGECTIFPGSEAVINVRFTDPKSFAGTEDEILSGFRQVRDEIENWIDKYFGI